MREPRCREVWVAGGSYRWVVVPGRVVTSPGVIIGSGAEVGSADGTEEASPSVVIGCGDEVGNIEGYLGCSVLSLGCA